MPVTIQHIVCLAIIFKLILQPQSANMFIRLLTFSRAIYIFISFDKLCAAAAVAAYQFANFNDKYTLWYRPHSLSRRNTRRKYTSKDLEMEGGKGEKAAWGRAMRSGLVSNSESERSPTTCPNAPRSKLFTFPTIYLRRHHKRIHLQSSSWRVGDLAV